MEGEGSTALAVAMVLTKVFGQKFGSTDTTRVESTNPLGVLERVCEFLALNRTPGR